ncbi:Calcium-dependent lipid-binding (CaLB domain) family protein [Rhynchospora pubera]|uniref:Calcium-dependent lipid-binding (CaLB domain) family protein n=1 Tax=Rhynchospora pubera TaxID=906938 RepID=A0AAV8FBQ1_9POAL|nr:Calcium-dependent lipid-binding (CaLB domain) family protein [Rhynchospora pubera]
METQLVEITLISAQGIKIPPRLHRIQTYAMAWVDPAHKLRTRIDRTGGPDPAWNDRFVFRVPTSSLLPDSSSAVCFEIYCTGGWYNNDSLVGSVRFLIGGERLLSKPPNSPSFAALGIRRPSGRVTGVLNIGAVLLEKIPLTVAEALNHGSAVGYRDLMRRPALRDRTNTATDDKEKGVGERREKQIMDVVEEDEEEEIDRQGGGALFCGSCLLRVPRKVYTTPYGEKFTLPMPVFSRSRHGSPKSHHSSPKSRHGSPKSRHGSPKR